MRNTRSAILLLIVALVGSLTAPSQLIPAGLVHAQQTTMSIDAKPVVDMELIRNGGFDLYGQFGEPNGWVKAGTGSGVDATAGQDGGPAMGMEAITEAQASLFQTLRLPTTTTAGVVKFDVRMTPLLGGSVAQIFVRVVTETDTLATALASGNVIADTGWLSINYTLTGADVANIQAAHQAGHPVYLIFDLFQNPAGGFKAYVDNVSFEVSGSTDVPSSAGSIAFVGSDASGNPKTVNRIDPDGTNRQTLWTHPSTVPDTNAIADVGWKPDATELAFSSNHESTYSAFNSDVYGLKPDGKGLRRITNPPSKAELDGGGYQFGTVTGTIQNNYKRVTTLLAYVEGAKSAVSVDIGDFNDEGGFTVPEVADLGVGSHFVVFIWSDANNANCREFAVSLVDVEPNKTVDTGTLTFNGTCGTYNSDSISWKPDGTQVAVDVITPKKFLATGQAIGSDLFSGPLTANQVAWSPDDDRVLYHSWTTDTPSNGIYMTAVNGGAGALLAKTGNALWVTPAWLPDGSGFVYAVDHEIRQYLIGSSTDTLLAEFGSEFVFNPSVSPDGKYIVFEWQTNTQPNVRDLWIMERARPVQMSALTTDGHSSDPDWSRKDPTTPGPTCTNLTGVTVSGPGAGTTGVDYAFSAGVSPSTSTAPITYQWSPTPASGQNTAQATYRWTSAGQQQVTVDVTNCSGTAKASDTHAVSVSTPTGTCTELTGVTIAGSSVGSTGVDYTYMADVSPGSATAPITYKWSPVPASGQNSAQATYRWTAAGVNQISVDVSNCNATATASGSKTVSIGTVPLQEIFLPVAIK